MFEIPWCHLSHPLTAATHLPPITLFLYDYMPLITRTFFFINPYFKLAGSRKFWCRYKHLCNRWSLFFHTPWWSCFFNTFKLLLHHFHHALFTRDQSRSIFCMSKRCLKSIFFLMHFKCYFKVLGTFLKKILLF